MATEKLSALDVANYVISLASNNVIGDDGEVEGVTNLKLQKILYFIEAYSLAVAGKSLFPDSIEAWEYGPVIPSVYHKFKTFGSSPIIQKETKVKVDEKTASLISDVWNTFNKYSASRLVDITHRHDPWKNTYAKNSKSGLKTSISRDEMKKYYKGLFA